MVGWALRLVENFSTLLVESILAFILPLWNAYLCSEGRIMPLIRSISGFRGTIGGRAGEGLLPNEIVNAVAAFASILEEGAEEGRHAVVIGRDARISGPMVRDLVSGTLQAYGFDVWDLGLTSTPTVEMSVLKEEASGGIVLTASHNPMEWNALKFLDANGEFISARTGEELIERAEQGDFRYAPYDRLGEVRMKEGGKEHIERILSLDLVESKLVEERNFKIVVDGVNSTGGVLVPQLLEAMGLGGIVRFNCEPDGRFAHDPEPLPEHLEGLGQKVRDEGADLGIVVDPDVDRLAFMDENGEPIGEEYTLVAVADHVLGQRSGPTVSNLSSSRALRDVAISHGSSHYASAVGEVNVVAKMKEVAATIGGEGNGGVILPELHYGRDALVGIALFLTHLAKKGMSCSELRKTYPDYYMSKEKFKLDGSDDVNSLLDRMAERYNDRPLNCEDGVKIEFEEEWVHLRRSNTEPIVRVYTESKSPEGAKALAERFVEELGRVSEGSRSIEN